MLRGRKRRRPSYYIPAPYYHGSESEDGLDFHVRSSRDVEAPVDNGGAGYASSRGSEDIPVSPQRSSTSSPPTSCRPRLLEGSSPDQDGNDPDSEEDISDYFFANDDEASEDEIYIEVEDEEEEAAQEVRPGNVTAAAANVPAADVPLADVPAHNVPLADVPAADVPAANVPLPDVPAADVPLADVPAAEEERDYHSLLRSLTEKWMTTELDHTVSKVASNAF